MEIIIKESTSYNNLSVLKKIHKDNWILKEVKITYNPTKGLPNENETENYPVKILFEDNTGEKIFVKILTLTAGYNGTGPNDLVDLLNWLGVKYNPEEILTKNALGEDGYIRLIY